MANSPFSLFPLTVTDEVIQVRRPIAVRLWGGLWAGAMAWCIYALIHTAFKSLFGVHTGSLAIVVIASSTLMYIAVLLGMMLMFLVLAGPCRLDCDLCRGTYEYRRGVPLPVTSTTGPLSDFASVVYRKNRVSSVYNPAMLSSYDEYRVYLVWSNAPRLWGLLPQPRLLMSIVKSEATAEAIANSLGARFSLPVAQDRSQQEIEVASQSFLRIKNEDEIIVCRPKLMRIVSGILATALGLGMIAIGMLSLFPGTHGGSGDSAMRTISAVIALTLSLPTLMFLLFSGPCLLHCDLRNRTYHFTRGFPFWVETTVGPLSDFDAVTFSGKTAWSAFVAAIVSYRVYLTWNKAPRLWSLITQPRIMMDYSPTRSQIERQANSIGKLLDLPVKEAGR